MHFSLFRGTLRFRLILHFFPNHRNNNKKKVPVKFMGEGGVIFVVIKNFFAASLAISLFSPSQGLTH